MVDNPDLSPASSASGRRRDTRLTPDDDLRSAFKTAAFVHVILLVLTKLVLDSGRTNQLCIVAMIGYWIAVLFILFRRQKSPTKLDFWFIRYGVIPLWLATDFVAMIVY